MLTPRTFIDPTRQPKPKKVRKGIRRVSLRRAKELREYSKRRKEFLELHPICQVWLAEHGITETTSAVFLLMLNLSAPRATQVHHKNKRHGARLNNESEWLAVCAQNHDRIERNKAWARENGFLRDI